MKLELKTCFIAICALMFCAASAAADTPPAGYLIDNFDDGVVSGWSFYQITGQYESGGYLRYSTTGSDPNQTKSSVNISTSSYKQVVIRMKVTGGTNYGSIYWNNGNGWSESYGEWFYTTNDGKFHVYILNLEGHSGWTGTVQAFRLDSTCASGAAVQIDYIAVIQGTASDPIYTHYPSTYGKTADTLDTHKCSWGNYSNDVTDYYAPKQSEVTSFKNSAYSLTGKQMVFLGDLGYSTFSANNGKTRCYVNYRRNKSLWTIFFPSDQTWGQSNRRPIVINPTTFAQSNNDIVFKEQRAYYAKLVEDYDCILVVANSGGSESFGMHSWVHNDLEDVIDLLHGSFGGDRSRVVFTGASRGGLVALYWAANPYNKNFTTLGVFADVAPVLPGTVIFEPCANYVLMGNIHNMIEGEYYYDAEGGRHECDSTVWQNTSRYSSQCYAVTGRSSASSANSAGPMGYISRYSGKVIGLTFSTNDCAIPFQGFLDFGKALEAQNIDYAANIILGGEHVWDTMISMSYVRGDTNTYVFDYFHYLMATVAAGVDPFVIGGTNYYKSHTAIASRSVSSLTPVYTRGHLPFAVRVAAKVARGQAWQIELFGPEGHHWWYGLYDPWGGPVSGYTGYGVFGSSEHAVASLTPLSGGMALGTYSWKFWYNGQEVSFETVLNDGNGAIPPVNTVVQSNQFGIWDESDGVKYWLGMGSWYNTGNYYGSGHIQAENYTYTKRWWYWSVQNNSSCYGGQQLVSNTAGDKLMYQFHGAGIYVVISKGPSGGTANVKIDGVSYSNISFYNSSNIYQQWVLITWPLLDDGDHYLELNVASGYAYVDSFYTWNGNQSWTPPSGYLIDNFDDGTITGWGFSGTSGQSESGGLLSFSSTNTDPNMWRYGLSISTSTYKKVTIRMKVINGTGFGQIFWDNGSGMSEYCSEHFVVKNDGKFHTYQINLSGNYWWSGTVSGFRLDPFSPLQGDVQIDYIVATP